MPDPIESDPLTTLIYLQSTNKLLAMVPVSENRKKRKKMKKKKAKQRMNDPYFIWDVLFPHHHQ